MVESRKSLKNETSRRRSIEAGSRARARHNAIKTAILRETNDRSLGVRDDTKSAFFKQELKKPNITKLLTAALEWLRFSNQHAFTRESVR